MKSDPTQLQMVDPAQSTDIRTNNEQRLRGTALVKARSAAGRQKGEEYYICAFSGGQLAMKRPRVMEAIAKADQLGETLRAVQAQRAQRGA